MSAVFATVAEAVDDLYKPMQEWARETGIEVVYPLAKNTKLSDGRHTDRYLDVHVRMDDSPPVTLRNRGVRVRNTGTLVMQLYTPVDANAGVPYDLAESLRNKYIRPNKACDVWITRARANYLGNDGKFAVSSIQADFSFDQVI